MFSVNVSCIEGANALVLFEVVDGTPGVVLSVDVAGQPAQVQVASDGLGRGGIQVRLDEPATVTVEFPSGPQRGELPAC